MSDDSAPTLTGSIIAKLELDDSQFVRKAEEAKATARDLGAMSPDIKVTADVGAALAKFAEAAAAEHALTAATDQDTQSRRTNTNSVQGGVSAMSALIAASPALVGGIASVGAAAVGLGAAFGVMSVSGLLAIHGIKDAMAVGDTVGNTYAAGIATLKGNFDQLGAVSANGMLSAFNGVVGDINQHMPFLNQTVGMFATLLGQVGGTALNGVLTGLERMNPLLITGGAELSKFVSWLTSFTSTNGFTQFVTYATDNLPGVMTLIEKLVTLGGDILTAFSPLGPVVVSVLSGLSDGLSSLPLPILAGLVTTATSLGVALKVVGSNAISGGITAVAEAIGLTGVMANLAVPVVGILTAAIAGVAVAFASSAASTDTASASVSTYASELERTNGAIDDSIRKAAAKALVDDGAAAAAQQLGINTQLLTGYVTGNADATATLQAKIDAIKSAYDNSSVSVDGLGRATHIVTQAQQDQYDAALKLEKGLNGQKGALQDAVNNQQLYNQMLNTGTTATDSQTQATQALAQRYGMSVQQYQAATAAQQSTAAQLAQTTLNMQLQGDAAGLLSQAFDAINNKGLSLAQSDTALAASANQTAAAFKQNGAAIDGNSAAAVANQQAIQNSVSAAQRQADATAKSTGLTQDGVVAYGKSKTALEQQLQAQGALTPAVQAYIDKLYDVNNFKPKPVTVEFDDANAKVELQAFQTMLNNLTSQKAVQITTDYVSNHIDTGVSNTTNVPFDSKGAQFHAGGGAVLSYLASGGFPGAPKGTDTVPAWLTPGEIVMNTAAVKSLGPDNLLTANRTGQWPGQASQQPQQMTMVGTLVLDSGEVMGTFRGIARAEASNAISGANRDARYRRVGV